MSQVNFQIELKYQTLPENHILLILFIRKREKIHHNHTLKIRKMLILNLKLNSRRREEKIIKIISVWEKDQEEIINVNNNLKAMKQTFREIIYKILIIITIITSALKSTLSCSAMKLKTFHKITIITKYIKF